MKQEDPTARLESPGYSRREEVKYAQIQGYGLAIGFGAAETAIGALIGPPR